MNRRSSQAGQALIATVIVMSLLLLVLLALLTQVNVGNRVVGRQLTYQGQAINAAQAGLAEGLSWFRRQVTQPVRTFAPAVNLAATPPVNDTEDPVVGIVRTYSISSPGRLMGRYEVRYGNVATGDGVLDVTQNKGKTAAAQGSVWQLESIGYVWIQNDSSKAFNTAPNQIISTQTVRSEIQKMAVNLPDGGAAIFAARCGGVNITARSKVQGGPGIGISCKNGTGNVTNNGVVTGATQIKQNSVAAYDIPSVFGVTTQELLGLADVNVTQMSDLPATLPAMGLIVIRANATFSNTQPLSGSGIMVVFGDLTVPANTNPDWNGVLYVTGNIIIGEPALVSGAIISANAAAASSVAINSGADVTEVDYDPSMITQINQQMGQYRFSRAAYWLGK